MASIRTKDVETRKILAIRSFRRSADSATNWREAADFDSEDPLWQPYRSESDQLAFAGHVIGRACEATKMGTGQAPCLLGRAERWHSDGAAS